MTDIPQDRVEPSNEHRLRRYSPKDPLKIIYCALPDHQKERFVRYRELWQRVDEERLALEFPLNIYIEPVSDCNLSCSFCIRSRAEWKQAAPQVFTKKRLGFERFKQIIDEGQRYGLPAIWVGASGEALLEKDLCRMMQYAHDHNIIDNILITNGTLLSPGIIDSLLDIPLTRLNVSLDAFSAQTYRKLRGGDYEKLMKNLNYLAVAKESKGSALPVVRVTFVETEENRQEREAFVEFWSRRADSIDIQKVHDFDVGGRPEDRQRDLQCSFPWRAVMVLANGDVLPCCSFYAVGNNTLGNIESSGIKEIWDSRRFKDFRDCMRSGRYTDACKLCYDSQH